MKLLVEAGAVSIIGRTALLNDEEQETLAQRISALLAEHGLGPHDIIINGQPLRLPVRKA